LPGPGFQISVFGDRLSCLRLNLLKNIQQGWRLGYSFGYRKAQPMGLSRIDIRVLAQKNYPGFVPGTGIKCMKNEICRRINNPGSIFSPDKFPEVLKVWTFKLILQNFAPTFFNPDISHACKTAKENEAWSLFKRDYGQSFAV
jgi:hypothetical protein